MFRVFFWVLFWGTVSFGALANFYDGRWDFHYENKTHSFNQVTSHRGSPLLSLPKVAKRFQILYELSSNKKNIVLKHKSGRIVSLNFQSSEVSGFWGKARLSRMPELINGSAYVPLDFGDRVLRPLLSGVAPKPLFSARLPFAVDVVLDAGHGGNDYGAIVREENSLYLEKDITLLLAKELKSLLEEEKIKVALIREDDVFLALPERTAFANRLNPKLFLSLHLNTSIKKNLRGFELYLLSLKSDEDKQALARIAAENMAIPEDLTGAVEKAVAELRARANFEESLSWAKTISSSLKGKIPSSSNRPIRQGPFYVLYGAAMPSVLVEFAFLNRKEDRELLKNSSRRKEILKPLAENLARKLKKGIVSQ